MNSKTIEMLQKLGITNECRLKLQFFYCTNRSTKARKLVNALKDLSYRMGGERTQIKCASLVIVPPLVVKI